MLVQLGLECLAQAFNRLLKPNLGVSGTAGTERLHCKKSGHSANKQHQARHQVRQVLTEFGVHF